MSTLIRDAIIITKERPRLLRRCVNTLLRDCYAHGRTVRVTVVDASESLDARLVNRRLLGAIARRFGPISYVDAESAKRLRCRLEESGCNGRLLAFSMSPGRDGDNRNLALLLTAGRAVMSLDDDVVARTYHLGQVRRDELSISGHTDTRDIEFYESRKIAVMALQKGDANILTEHEAALGKSISELVATATPPVSSEYLCGHLRRQLKDPMSVVTVTLAGVVGDAGIYCPYQRLRAGAGPVKDAMSRSEAAFDLSLRSRELHAVAGRLTLVHADQVMTYCIGLMNRGSLPPFMPIGRNTDGLFGCMLSRFSMSNGVVHLPAAVVHDSPRPSRYDGDTIASASAPRIADVLIYLCRRAAAEGCRSYEDFAGVLLRRAANSQRLFSSWFVEVVRAYWRHELHLIQAVCESQSHPLYWRVAAARYLAEYSRVCLDPSNLVPIEFRSECGVLAGFQATQRFLRNYAELVLEWPVIWTRAKALSFNSLTEEVRGTT